MKRQPVQGRADHCDPAGAGGGEPDGGRVPQARDLERDVLQVEGEVRRSRRVGCQAAEGAGGREREAEEASGRDDAGQRHPEGHQQPKVVTPAARRQAVAHACAVHEVSERRACQALGVDRSSMRYRSRRACDAAVRLCIRELAAQRRRFGYRRLHLLLTREGHHMNHKRFRRLYREEKLQVRRRGGRKRALGVRAPIDAAERSQRALVARLRVRLLHRRPALPHPGDRRRLHAREPGADPGHIAVGSAGGTRAGCADRTSRPAKELRLRQRHGADQHGDPEVERDERRRLALHRAGQADSRTPSRRASSAGCATSA